MSTLLCIKRPAFFFCKPRLGKEKGCCIRISPFAFRLSTLYSVLHLFSQCTTTDIHMVVHFQISFYILLHTCFIIVFDYCTLLSSTKSSLCCKCLVMYATKDVGKIKSTNSVVSAKILYIRNVQTSPLGNSHLFLGPKVKIRSYVIFVLYKVPHQS